MTQRVGIVGTGLLTAVGVGVEANVAAIERHANWPGNPLPDAPEDARVREVAMFHSQAGLGALSPESRLCESLRIVCKEALRDAPTDGIDHFLIGTTFHDLAGLDASALPLRSPTVISAASGSGGVVLGIGFQMIRSGIAQKVLVAAVDVVTPHVLAGLDQIRAISSGGSKPFHKDRDGMGLSEGAAAVLLCKTGDTSVAVVGHGESNAGQLSGRPSVTALETAMQRALRSCGSSASAIDHINLHAPGTRAGDSAEVDAIDRVFGRSMVIVSSYKSTLGHCQGAAGLVEATVLTSAMGQDKHLATPMYLASQSEWPDLRTTSEHLPPSGPQMAMSVSCGLGNVNVATVLAVMP